MILEGDGQKGSWGQDSALLTQRNHTGMIVSTLGVWAAYLAGGDTVYRPAAPCLTPAS